MSVDDNGGLRYPIREESAFSYFNKGIICINLYRHELESKLLVMSFELDSTTVPVKSYDPSKELGQYMRSYARAIVVLLG